MESHRDEIPCSERTLYTYIGKGYLTARNADMRRTVRYKKRHRKVEVEVSPRKKAGHHYRDYQNVLLNEPKIRVVEMDTVEGVKGGKIQQTFFWREEKLMLSFLLDSKDMSGTVGTLDYLEERLGRERFSELFPLILTVTELNLPIRSCLNTEKTEIAGLGCITVNHAGVIRKAPWKRTMNTYVTYCQKEVHSIG